MRKGRPRGETLVAMRVRGGRSGGSTVVVGDASDVKPERGWLRRWWQRFHGPPASRPPAQAGAAQADAAASEGGRQAGARTAPRLEPGGCVLLAGAYITDGSSLFRVEHTHTDRGSGEAFVELENCTTLELSVWPVDTLAERRVRCVVPVGAAEPQSAAIA